MICGLPQYLNTILSILIEVISSPDKVVFKNPDITKIEIARYYSRVAEKMLPYIKNRKLSLVVCPQGIENCFFKKNISEGVPLSPINDTNDLLSHVQNNAIEFHTWGSTIGSIEKPDVMVFDLDPDEGLNLESVRQGVRDLKSVLDSLGLVSLLKTSGNKGYHIAVPLKPCADWDFISDFAKNVAVVMERKWPERYTSNVRKENRKGKIFIDWIRNGRGATSVAPYSIRSKTGARVSMPIGWNMLNRIAPNDITMEECLKRIKKNDPWKDFFKISQKIRP